MSPPRPKRISAQDNIPPLDLIIFGVSGDLATRKLLPALLIGFQIGELGEIGGHFCIIWLGQRALSRPDFQKFISEKVADQLDPNVAREWPIFLQCIDYVCLNATSTEDYAELKLPQLLCIVAMEPPVSLSPDAVRDEKLKILKAPKRFGPTEIANNVVRGAYRERIVNGTSANGYADEDGVPAGSTTETYVALKAEINSWRWAGVPFFLRTNKRMPERVAEIDVRLGALPHSVFSGVTGAVHPNTLHISLQPDEGLRLRLMAKTPGEGMHLRATELELDFHEAFKTPRMEAYERLLLDVMRDRPTLFTRGDELEAAWEWVEPILAAWEADSEPPRPYTAGTWGPPAATAMLGREGMLWRDEA